MLIMKEKNNESLNWYLLGTAMYEKIRLKNFDR